MGNSLSPNESHSSGDSIPCRIVIVGPTSGDDALLELCNLPANSKIIAHGSNIDELLSQSDTTFTEGNVLLNVTGNAQILSYIIPEMPDLVWVHSLTAGVDHILFEDLIENSDIVLTNAKGIYSSSLAEYVMGAATYFNKDIPRLQRQKTEKSWDRYTIGELRGKTMGILGYGDIGVACAKLAKAYGMQVIALRRNPNKTDSHVDKMYGPEDILEVISQSDFLVSILPLTVETSKILGEREFSVCKKGSYFISIGRGAVVDEDALITALRDGQRLYGAALDVFATEPLPADSPLWTLPNVLISPHNADMTAQFRHDSVRFFCKQCAKFISNPQLLENVVNKSLGY